MRFEKLNEDKIRITLSHDDLVKKDIDFHSFMSNSIESQALFFDMLEEAEKEIGFVTKDYLICIEALAMAGGDFILTVTRTLPERSKLREKTSRKKVHIKRKNYNNTSNMQVIYLFSNFDDFCLFVQFYSDNFKYTNFAKKVLLYKYNNGYYLLLDNINDKFVNLKKLFFSITEFATPISNSDILERKIFENGELIMKHNAVSTGIKHFAQK